MKVVLDTSEVMSDPAFAGVYFKLLREYMVRSGAGLIVPNVAYREALRLMSDEITAGAKRILETAQKLERRFPVRLLDRVTADLIGDLADADDMLSYTWYGDVESGFRQRVDEMGVQIGADPEVSHARLVEAELARRKPFDGSGRGYRDALIWCSVIEIARSEPEVVFVTRNKNDFPKGPGSEPHEDLLQWLRDDGAVSGRVRIFHSLEEFAKSDIIPDFPRAGDKAALESGRFEKLDLRCAIDERKAEIYGRFEDVMRRSYPAALAARTFRWWDLDAPRVDVHDLRELAEERELIVASVTYSDVVADYGFTVFDAARGSYGERVLVIAPRGVVEAGITDPKYLQLSARLAIIFQRQTGNVQEFQVTGVRIDSDPSEWANPPPYFEE
ncbi:MAG TPA: PIN domain-containing protein [Anaerolineae bacterium]|nr:PIN domain-containing protein [Anaerolineae bacterium]